MKNIPSPSALYRLVRRRWLLSGLLSVAVCGSMVLGFHEAHATPGSGEPDSGPAPRVAQPPTVQVIQPQQRTIVRVVGQPSFVESYERTSIYPKVSGYIQKWNVDIGDHVKKGQILATLYVPELREDWQTKKRTVRLDREKVDLAQKLVAVAEENVKAASANLEEAKAILLQYQAQVDRWSTEVARLTREVSQGTIDPQVLLESQNQFKASTAARNAARATILKAKAELLSKQATLAEQRVNVDVAQAQESVAESDARRLEAWVGYLTLRAPYDGVIVARNANTWDFVTPRSGDPSADHNVPHLSPSGTAAPIYVMDRTDVVRIFVDVPEADANFVRPGTQASVLVRAFRDQWIPATVTRTSWALNVKSRTLRAEIDLRNIDDPIAYHDPGTHPMAPVASHDGNQILPGMYAYGKVILQRPNVWAVPVSALVHAGDDTSYWSCVNGHAVKVNVQTGISDDQWIEVTSREAVATRAGEASWKPINGSERLITGDLAALAQDAPVQLAKRAAPSTRASSADSGPLARVSGS